MREIWKAISEFEGMYEVSNLGRVKSLRKTPFIILSTSVINSGYEAVRFKIGGKTINRLVHRVVAKEFCEGFVEGYTVNHKDAERLNNCADNLEWTSYKENIHDSMKRGTHSYKEAHAVAHERRKRPTAQYTKEGELVTVFVSAREASRAVEGAHENHISHVALGKRKSHAGFVWRYLDSR